MLSFVKQNMIAIALIGVVAIGGGWYFFSSGSGEDEILTTENVADAQGEVEQNIVDTLLKLRSVSLSGTIFSDPAFSALQDFGTQIIQEPFGRLNPFAPRETGSGILDRDADLFGE